jgi:hypothetical protein
MPAINVRGKWVEKDCVLHYADTTVDAPSGMRMTYTTGWWLQVVELRDDLPLAV